MEISLSNPGAEEEVLRDGLSLEGKFLPQDAAATAPEPVTQNEQVADTLWPWLKGTLTPEQTIWVIKLLLDQLRPQCGVWVSWLPNNKKWFYQYTVPTENGFFTDVGLVDSEVSGWLELAWILEVIEKDQEGIWRLRRQNSEMFSRFGGIKVKNL